MLIVTKIFVWLLLMSKKKSESDLYYSKNVGVVIMHVVS